MPTRLSTLSMGWDLVQRCSLLRWLACQLNPAISSLEKKIVCCSILAENKQCKMQYSLWSLWEITNQINSNKLRQYQYNLKNKQPMSYVLHKASEHFYFYFYFVLILEIREVDFILYTPKWILIDYTSSFVRY